MNNAAPNIIVKFLRNKGAASAVEFAIVAPVFILMLFGLCAYGIFFGTSHAVQQLAADAARASIAGLNDHERKLFATDFIDRNLESYMFLERESMQLAMGESEVDANQFLISLTYDASRLPIWNLYPPLPMPSKTISKSSTIRIGGI